MNMATRTPDGRLRHGLVTVGTAAAIAATSGFVAYHALMAAMRVVIGAP